MVLASTSSQEVAPWASRTAIAVESLAMDLGYSILREEPEVKVWVPTTLLMLQSIASRRTSPSNNSNRLKAMCHMDCNSQAQPQHHQWTSVATSRTPQAVKLHRSLELAEEAPAILKCKQNFPSVPIQTRCRVITSWDTTISTATFSPKARN